MAEMGRMLSVVDGERVVVETFEVPEPGPGEVLVRVNRTQVSAGSEKGRFPRRLPSRPQDASRLLAEAAGVHRRGARAGGRARRTGIRDRRQGVRLRQAPVPSAHAGRERERSRDAKARAAHRVRRHRRAGMLLTSGGRRAAQYQARRAAAGRGRRHIRPGSRRTAHRGIRPHLGRLPDHRGRPGRRQARAVESQRRDPHGQRLEGERRRGGRVDRGRRRGVRLPRQQRGAGAGRLRRGGGLRRQGGPRRRDPRARQHVPEQAARARDRHPRLPHGQRRRAALLEVDDLARPRRDHAE